MVVRYRPSQHPESGRRGRGRPRVRPIKRQYTKLELGRDKLGRPRGSPNKISERIRAAAAASGQLPHEFALDLMRKGVGFELRGEFGVHILDWEDIKWAVALAAPYYAARMANIRIGGHDGGPLKVFHLDPALLAKCTPEELQVLEKFFGERVNGTGGQGPVINGQALLPSPLSAVVEEDDDYEKTLQ